MKRKTGDEEEEEEKKSTVFLLFCVSVGSFRDELTVVFRSLVHSFSTNSYAFKVGGTGQRGEGGCWVPFSLVFSRKDVGRARGGGTARPPL